MGIIEELLPWNIIKNVAKGMLYGAYKTAEELAEAIKATEEAVSDLLSETN